MFSFELYFTLGDEVYLPPNQEYVLSDPVLGL